MPKMMCKVIALGFEGVIAFVVNLPPRSTLAANIHDRACTEENIGGETVGVELFAYRQC